jgi:NTE family protein
VTKLREALYTRVQTQKNDQACAALLFQQCPKAPEPVAFAADIDPYVIEINFEQASQIPGEKPRYYLDMPTSFTLSKEQVKKLVAIGPKLLKAAPQYQCMIKVLAAEAESKPRPEECPVGAGIFP